MDHLYWSSAVVLVYDITNMQSYQHAADFLRDIKQERPNHPCLLLGNKIDLEHQREITLTEVEHLTSHYSNCLHAEVSAVDSEHDNIHSTFQQLFRLSQTIVVKSEVKRRRSIVDMAKAFSTLLRSGSTKHSDSKTSS